MSSPDASDITPAYLKRQYLMSYNAISAALWFGVLGRVLMWGAHGGMVNGPEEVYEASERYTRLTQSLAAVEVLHCAVGMFGFRHSSGTAWFRVHWRTACACGLPRPGARERALADGWR